MATNTITNKFENHLLSIKDKRQKRIQRDLRPTYNQHHEISFGFGGTDNARTLIYEPGLGLAQMQKCIEY